MSTFLRDTFEINKRLKNDIRPDIIKRPLTGYFLPFYIAQNGGDIMVVLKREIMYGGQISNNEMKLGLSTISFELPIDNKITLEDVLVMSHLDTSLVNSISVGSAELRPHYESAPIELMLIEIEPPVFKDERAGIIYQEIGSYEIGALKFNDILPAINAGLIQDLVTRLILNELYLVVQSGNSGNLNEFSEPERSNTVTTSDIPDDVIASNTQMDYGSIYKF